MTCYIQLYDEGIGGKREGGRERERERPRKAGFCSYQHCSTRIKI